MCGHGTIGTVTAALEHGLVAPRIPGRISIEAPAGKVDIEYEMTGDRVKQVRIFNVASYLHAKDVEVIIPRLGAIRLDLSYGGNFYAIIEPQENWPGLDGMSASDIIQLSTLVRSAVQHALSPVHVVDPRIRGVSHVMWCDEPKSLGADARNAVFYGDKAIDRSPCGTGSSARMAQLHARDRLRPNESFVHESIIGTKFDCKIVSETTIGGRVGILPSIAGWAKVTGHNTSFIDSDDPLANGFQLQ